jgi:hypothetical protein
MYLFFFFFCIKALVAQPSSRYRKLGFGPGKIGKNKIVSSFQALGTEGLVFALEGRKKKIEN